MAYVYTVKGSEDGLIGVFGSFKRARVEAEHYSQGSLERVLRSEEQPKGFLWIFDGQSTAEVEKWFIE